MDQSRDGEPDSVRGPERGFWGIFGRISAVVLVLAAVVGMVQALWPRGPRLTAQGVYASFRLPPDLIADLVSEKAAPAFDRRLGDFSALGPDQERARRATQEASLRLKYPHQGYYRIVVRNRGTSPASDMALVVPFPGIAEIVTTEGSRVDKGAPRFALGRLIPGDEVTIHYWTALPAPAGLRDFRIIHSAGTGHVDFQYATYGALAVLAENWPAVVISGLSVSVSIVVVWLSFRARRNAASTKP